MTFVLWSLWQCEVGPMVGEVGTVMIEVGNVKREV